jgi:hypothetical protein
MFFIFHLNEVAEDVRYVGERYFPDFKDDDPTIAKGTRLKQQRLILELCNYRSWNAEQNSSAVVDKSTLIARCRSVAFDGKRPVPSRTAGTCLFTARSKGRRHLSVSQKAAIALDWSDQAIKLN